MLLIITNKAAQDSHLFFVSTVVSLAYSYYQAEPSVLGALRAISYNKGILRLVGLMYVMQKPRCGYVRPRKSCIIRLPSIQISANFSGSNSLVNWQVKICWNTSFYPRGMAPMNKNNNHFGAEDTFLSSISNEERQYDVLPMKTQITLTQKSACSFSETMIVQNSPKEVSGSWSLWDLMEGKPQEANLSEAHHAHV